MSDAFYHLNINPVRRSEGQNIVACAAYIHGARIENNHVERGYSSFTHLRERVLASGMMLPENAPDWMQDSATLWNAVERKNKRRDAQLGMRIILAIPYEISRDKWQNAVEDFAKYISDTHQSAVDFALHAGNENENPHAHFLITNNIVTAEGLGKKNREMGKQKFYYDTRDAWAKIGNAYLSQAKSSKTLHAESYAKRGVDKAPERHRGKEHPQQERTREERTMGRPTGKERLLYPNISRRPDWPPAMPDERTTYDDKERQEVLNYYNDLEKRRLNREPLSPDERNALDIYNEGDMERRYFEDLQKRASNREPMTPYEEESLKRYETGEIERDLYDNPNYDRTMPSPEEFEREELWKKQHDKLQYLDGLDQQIADIKRRDTAQEARQALRERARSMSRTPEENRLLKEIEHLPRDIQDEIKAGIIAKRVDRLLEQDNRDRQDALEREIRKTAKERERQGLGSYAEEYEKERATPREDAQQRQLQEAEEKMRDEMEREHDRDDDLFR